VIREEPELGSRLDPPAAEDAPPLTLGRASPDTVVDPVRQCVLETFFLHRAVGADLAGAVDADTVGREPIVRGATPTFGTKHPLLLVIVDGRSRCVHIAQFNGRGIGPVPRNSLRKRNTLQEPSTVAETFEMASQFAPRSISPPGAFHV
jgi:hypothetical protein